MQCSKKKINTVLFVVGAFFFFDTVFADWNTNFLELYQGDNHQIGQRFRRVIKYGHHSGWTYGENNIYFEIINPDRKNTVILGQITPSVSFSKIAKRTVATYPLIDTLLSAQFNFDEVGGREYSWGFSFYWDVSPEYFKYLLTSIYHRKDANLPGSTYSLQASTQVDLSRDAFMSLYLDWVPKRQSTRSKNILLKTEVYFDIGQAFYKRYRIYLGPGFHIWRNKLGVRGADEKVFTIRFRTYL